MSFVVSIELTMWISMNSSDGPTNILRCIGSDMKGKCFVCFFLGSIWKFREETNRCQNGDKASESEFQWNAQIAFTYRLLKCWRLSSLRCSSLIFVLGWPGYAFDSCNKWNYISINPMLNVNCNINNGKVQVLVYQVKIKFIFRKSMLKKRRRRRNKLSIFEFNRKREQIKKLANLQYASHQLWSPRKPKIDSLQFTLDKYSKFSQPTCMRYTVAGRRMPVHNIKIEK